MSTDPTQQIFWFASRAFGIVAIIMLAISVGLGLAMSGRIIRRPGLPAKLKRYHEASTLVTLGLIVAHAAILLADGYLRPGIAGITLPFQMSYRPLWTGIGIIAALACRDPRPQLLRPQVDRRKDLALAAPLDHRRLPPRPRPRRRRRHGRALALDDRLADHPHRADRVRLHLPRAPQAIATRPPRTGALPAHGRRRVNTTGHARLPRTHRRTCMTPGFPHSTAVWHG